MKDTWTEEVQCLRAELANERCVSVHGREGVCMGEWSIGETCINVTLHLFLDEL